MTLSGDPRVYLLAASLTVIALFILFLIYHLWNFIEDRKSGKEEEAVNRFLEAKAQGKTEAPSKDFDLGSWSR